MNKDLKQGRGVKSEVSPADGKPKLCAVCKSVEGTVFVEITNCNLCTKCQNDLSDSFAYMFENRDDDEYPEL